MVTPVVREVAEDIAEKNHMTILPEDLDLVVALYEWSFVGIALDWLDGLIEKSYEKHLDKAMAVIDGSMEHALQKLARPS